MEENTDRYLTIKEAAKILGVTPLTLRNWDKSGKFPTSRHPINNYRVYRLSELVAFMATIASPKKPESTAQTVEPEPEFYEDENRVKKLDVTHLKDWEQEP